MIAFILYITISASLYYLGSQAKITEFLWSRYPGSGLRTRTKSGNYLGADGVLRTDPPPDTGFAAFMACPACVGFWWSLALGCVGYWRHVPYMGLPGRWWVTVLFTGLAGIVWTPLLARAQRWALES